MSSLDELLALGVGAIGATVIPELVDDLTDDGREPPEDPHLLANGSVSAWDYADLDRGLVVVELNGRDVAMTPDAAFSLAADLVESATEAEDAAILDDEGDGDRDYGDGPEVVELGRVEDPDAVPSDEDLALNLDAIGYRKSHATGAPNLPVGVDDEAEVDEAARDVDTAAGDADDVLGRDEDPRDDEPETSTLADELDDDRADDEPDGSGRYAADGE